MKEGETGKECEQRQLWRKEKNQALSEKEDLGSAPNVVEKPRQ
jgi:hypothetical protein